MKKILSISILALAFVIQSLSQTTLTLYPDKDAMIRHCTNPSYINNQYTNYGNYGYVSTLEWTWSGYPVIYKSLIGIDLSQLPENATITEAKLYLYGTGGHVTNITTGNSGYKSNASYLRRVTTSWGESTVTWNTAPTTVTNNQVTLANSSTTDQDYVIDVTNLIKDIQANPTTSDGLMLSLVTEERYTKMIFASSDHATSSMHPKLEITYTSGISFPDIASFEFVDTKWEDVDGDDLDWTRRTGPTPSGNTGPSSANHGKYYAFINASSPNYPSKVAYLLSPAYRLIGKDNASLCFDYHMYGTGMGQLELHVSDDSGATWSASSIWSKTGNQGNAWNSAVVDLSSYLEETILLRFKATTGSSYSSDIALDNIRVSTTTKANLSSEGNYIHTSTMMSENGTSGPMQHSVQYFDGLGRYRQEVGVGNSPDGKDMVKPIDYDNYGRILRDYLPFAAGDEENGTFRDYETSGDDVLGMQEEFYQALFSLSSSPYAYSRTVFEESPLNRVLEQGGPGEDFNPIEETYNASEHVQEFEYGTNTATEVRCFGVDASGNLTNSPTYYSENTLYKNTFSDEDGNETEEFKDMLGQVILKRSFEGSNSLSTYFVYDDFGLLRHVIPPKALGDNGIPTFFTILQLCYYYEYDGRKRMIEKRLPRVKSVYMVYDTRDRLVLVQDGVLRNSDEWHIIVYDELNRPVIKGIWDGAGFSFPDNISTIDNYQNYQATWNSSTHDYYLSSAIYNETTVQSKTYYDDYDFSLSSFYSGLGFNATDNIDTYEDNDGTSNGYFDRVKGQITGSATRVLDGIGSSWVNTVNYYDDKYRVIQTQSTLYPQGTSMNSTEYDFIGNVMQTLEIQTVNSVTNSTLYQYTYDHANRLLNTYVFNNSDNAVLLAQNKYNELGQLKEKSLHSDDNSDFTQTVDYYYNMRGWLTSINDPESLGDDKFGMRLFYQDVSVAPGTVAKFNGNISSISWKHTGGNYEGYAFDYDELNRLVEGDYKTNSGSSWTISTNYKTSYQYGLNGNISTLTRKNSSGTIIDNLTYDYTNTGDQLNFIYDASLNSAGVYDQNTSGADYEYDSNGNLTLDRNKDIEIDYNYLNLPEKIQEEGGSGDELLYIYDANGTKWLKKFNDGSTITKTMYAGSFVYEDTDNNGTDEFGLDYILNPEGKIDKLTSSVDYQYNLKDHLGNTRVVFDGAGTIRQKTDYYPFGMTSYLYSSSNDNKYLYNGKELQDEQLGGINLDWYDFNFRYYDPALARFVCSDPLADQFPHVSPYNYAENRPIDGIDLWGLQYISAYNAMHLDAMRAKRGDTGGFSGRDLMKAEVKGTATGFKYGGMVMSMFTGNPAAIILMPTALGLNLGKDIMPEKFQDEPDNLTGAVFSIGDDIRENVTGESSDIFQETGELIESLATGKGLFKKANSTIDLIEKVTKPIEILNEAADVVEEISNNSSIPSKINPMSNTEKDDEDEEY